MCHDKLEGCGRRQDHLPAYVSLALPRSWPGQRSHAKVLDEDLPRETVRRVRCRPRSVMPADSKTEQWLEQGVAAVISVLALVSASPTWLERASGRGYGQALPIAWQLLGIGETFSGDNRPAEPRVSVVLSGGSVITYRLSFIAVEIVARLLQHRRPAPYVDTELSVESGAGLIQQ